MIEEATDRLRQFSAYRSKPKSKLTIRGKNRYGSFCYFEDHDGVILVGFGDDGFEPDKDAVAFDKKDLPKVLEFLTSASKEGY